MSNPGGVKDRYERFADRYDAIFAERQKAKIKQLIASLPTAPRQPILDLGAGTGLVGQCIDAPVVAVDFSPAMLAHAKGDRVLADVRALPFADERFGCVFSVSALIELDDLTMPIREMIRVTRPGGWIALSVLKTEDLEGVHRVLSHELGLLYPRLDLGEDMGFVFQQPEKP